MSNLQPHPSDTDYLLALCDQVNWTLRSNMPWWVVIEVPAYKDVRYLVKAFGRLLSSWARTGMGVFVRYESEITCQIDNEGNLMSNLTTPEVLIPHIGGSISLNNDLLTVLGEMLASPERSIGLVRLSDERQLSVSGGANGKYLVGASVEQATQWHRADYWHPEDLYEFNREWQRMMTPGSTQWFEYKYRSFDPLAPSYARGPQFCDFEFVTRYRLVQGPKNELYHVAENMDMIEIA